MRSRCRTLLLCPMTILAVGGAVADAASAMEFEWHVSGKPLTVEEKKAATLTGGAYIMRGTILGHTVRINCQKLFSEKEFIMGGKPGPLEGAQVFTECTLSEVAGCTVGGTAKTITITPLGRLVEALKGLKPKAEGLSFGNKAGVGWGTVSLTGCSIAGSYSLEGEMVAEVEPEQVEKPALEVIFPHFGNIPEYKDSSGKIVKVELLLDGSALAIEGHDEMALSPKVEFGAY